MFFRNIYPKITKNDIDNFSETYINSELEIKDLINFYNENDGDMKCLLETIPLSCNSDKERFLSIYEDLFNKNVLVKTIKFSSTKNKIKKLNEDDPEEVEEELKKFDDLYSMIQLKKRTRVDFMTGLSN